MTQSKPLNRELNFATETIREAGELLLLHRDNPRGISQKDDNTPVSDADRDVSDFLYDRFSHRFPRYAILDEERKEDGLRFNREYCWVTDPLDCTRGFLEGTDEFGIIIGLLRNFKPVLGVTYKPQNNELAYAVKDQGAYIVTSDGKQKLHVDTSNELRVLVSSSRTNEDLERILEGLNPVEVYRMGGSLKIVEVAKGKGNIFLCPRASTMCLWDLCGTSVILEEAGGYLTDFYGNIINYKKERTSHNLGIIAANEDMHTYGLQIIGNVLS